MTLADVRARFRRGFARIWEWLKKRFTWKRKQDFAWSTEPRDAAHALYRERFERFAEGMPHLPRTKTNETTEAFLAVSQTAQMLHEYGDDPIRVPSTGRIIRPDDRLATFGAVGQPMGFVGALGSSASLWIVAAGAVVCASGWVTNEISSANYKAERAAHSETKGELEDAQVAVARVSAELRSARGQLDILEEQRDRSVAAAAAATRLAAESRQRERARNHAIQSVLVNDEPPAWSLRDDAVGGEGSAASGGDRGSAGDRSR